MYPWVVGTGILFIFSARALAQENLEIQTDLRPSQIDLIKPIRGELTAPPKPSPQELSGTPIQRTIQDNLLERIRIPLDPCVENKDQFLKMEWCSSLYSYLVNLKASQDPVFKAVGPLSTGGTITHYCYKLGRDAGERAQISMLLTECVKGIPRTQDWVDPVTKQCMNPLSTKYGKAVVVLIDNPTAMCDFAKVAGQINDNLGETFHDVVTDPSGNCVEGKSIFAHDYWDLDLSKYVGVCVTEAYKTYSIEDGARVCDNKCFEWAK